MELGRSCVEEGYRTMPTLQLLWQGIAAYVFEHDIKLMFGCASFHGTDPDAFSDVLTYLHHNHLAPEDMRPRAVAERYESMARASIDGIDARQALRDLPPLIKGYLRLGGYVGDGAVVDHQFNTTDICIVLPTEKVTERYYKHYERTARVS
jgi:putative hemolysin